MIYNLPWFTIILTFINVTWLQIDIFNTGNPQYGVINSFYGQIWVRLQIHGTFDPNAI